MQELRFVEKGRLEWREAPEPRLEDDRQALVRPVAVATCDIDLGIVRGAVPYQEPFPFGHEGVAEVTEVGDAVTTVEPGALVSVPFQISCGECGRCRRGQTGNCESVPRMSMYGLPIGPEYGGFLSDVVRVPYADAMLVPIPDGVEPASVASLSDNIVDGWRTVGPPLEAEPGAAVLICGGAGSIALYATEIATALGAERVDFAGGSPEHRELAERLGATLADEEFPDRLGPYPITVDASADEAGLACALRSTEPDGICTSIGIYFQPQTAVPLLEMFTKGMNFYTGRPHARAVMPSALQLVADGRFHPELVTAERASWDDAADAVASHRAKLVIARPGGLT
jgi:threonine dehydrogenase-like Zn-dependent dehydrogenase